MKLLPAEHIFVDADAIIALLRRDDVHHAHAWEIYGELRKERVRFKTNQIALFEAGTVISQRVGHKAALRLLMDVKEREIFKVIEYSKNTFDVARTLFEKQTSKNVSLFDCFHMAFCESQNIRSVFSFDTAYQANGFQLVTK